jgi:aspartyl-tRNA synthetase
MASGFDRYFQIARCYRDEDARGDRQPEFTQIDIEMSFVNRDDVLAMTEALMVYVFKKTLDIQLPAYFKRLSYEEAMENYGTDKPDLRFALPLKDFSPYVAEGDFRAFKDVLAAGGAVKALVVPAAAFGSNTGYSRKQIEELEAHAKIYKAKGLAWMKAVGTESAPVFEGGVSKFFSTAKTIMEGLDVKPGDLILMAGDQKRKIANIALGAVRSKLGKDLELINTGSFEFVWIVDFPLFEFNEEEQRWEAAHHLFSYPQTEYHKTLESDPGSVKGDMYDLVLNGYELASGSIRIHDPELQKRIFSIVGISEAEAETKFGFLTKAFKFGAPPHGGIAPGLDRLVMLMAGKSSIKEVIAFPKNSFAVSPMDNCPNKVDQKQLDELRLKVSDLNIHERIS